MAEEKGEKKVQKATAAREEVKTVVGGVECAMEVGGATISAHASSEEACKAFKEGWGDIAKDIEDKPHHEDHASQRPAQKLGM